MTDYMWNYYADVCKDYNAYCELTGKMCDSGDCRKCVFALAHHLVKELKE